MKKKSRKNKQDMFDSATRVFELPMEARRDYSKIISIDDNDFYVENYKKIIKYTQQEICFSTAYNIITFFGDDMFLRSFSSENIIIAGHINKIIFDRRKDI